MSNNNVREYGIFLTLQELSKYLNINEKTLYARVSCRKIPHYKIGRLLRFKMSEIDAWMEEQKVLHSEPVTTASAMKKHSVDIDRVIRNTLDEVHRTAYSRTNGKPDRNVKGRSRKEDL